MIDLNVVLQGLRRAQREIAALRDEIKWLSRRIKDYEGDAKWRQEWHQRLGRGALSEGRFYESLAKGPLRQVFIVFEVEGVRRDVVYVTWSKDNAEAWAKDRLSRNARLRNERAAVLIEEWGVDGDETT